jgi:hypothetical protein
MTATSPFLSHLNHALIEAAYRAGAGNELDSGKLLSPESSAALVANAFGLFLDRPQDLPPIPGTDGLGWPAQRVKLEACVRFPWAGGRHPWLDVLIETSTHLIGVESKRFEPFRSGKRGSLSDTYWRGVWGDKMGPVEAVRDALRDGAPDLNALDATQLVKHMFGLRSESHRRSPVKPAALVYLYCEPDRWPDGRAIGPVRRTMHATSVGRFGAAVGGAEVGFCGLAYKALFASWSAHASAEIRSHAEVVQQRFLPL